MSAKRQPIDEDAIRRAVDGIVTEIAASKEWGKAGAKIGALAGIDTHQFGMAVLTRDGALIGGGDCDTAFSIQSISKVFSLALALERCGEALWQRVGREPSGDPFNSIVDLERHEGIPRNPFINAGALVVVDMLLGTLDGESEPEAVVEFVAGLLGEGEAFGINEEVARSDETAGHLNRALASLAKHFGNFENAIDRVMQAYVRQCAIELTCRQLARVGSFLMLEGAGDAARPSDAALRRARRINALMMTCGQYDGSGDFAYRVGLPAKSGVGGGILAIVPNTASVAVWSPGLDGNGNSLLGTLALEMLTDRIDWSVFGAVTTR
ncbi:glutaminase [soil metagenome]